MKKVTLGDKIFWTLSRTIFGLTFIPFFRVSPKYKEPLPKEGEQPYLLLGNHVSLLDPFFTGFYAKRRVHFMASAFWFRSKIAGTFLHLVGSFPKMKFAKDHSSMATLTEYFEQGEVVCVYPEGRRSWDGHTLEVLPNIGKLIKRLNAPVVYSRILTGHYHHPRWAPYPRLVPVKIEYSELVRYPESATAEEIEADVQKRITLNPDEIPLPKRSWGFRLAYGLPGFLWACPECLEVEGLQRNGNTEIQCKACARKWKLDLANILHPLTENTSKFTVAQASRLLQEKFGTPPKIPGLVDAVIEDNCNLRNLNTEEAWPGTAKLVVNSKTEKYLIVVNNEKEIWRVNLRDIYAISIEGNKVLQFRLDKNLFRLELLGRSVVKWQIFLRAHKREAER